MLLKSSRGATVVAVTQLTTWQCSLPGPGAESDGGPISAALPGLTPLQRLCTVLSYADT
jgi:hypothetical protein